MAYWNGAGYGGIAAPCPANNKTLKRRLQRKHTQQSYRQMKEKLLSFLKPMPLAAYSADLEHFRQELYANNDDENALSTRGPDCSRCQWCGIWMPLPRPIIITTDVKEASSTSEAAPVEEPSTIITTVVKEASYTPEPDPLTCQLDKVGKAVDELLELSLCQAQSSFGQRIALDKGRSLWATGPESIFAADAYTPSGEQRICNDYSYSFKRTRASPAEVPEASPNSASSFPVPSQLYSTDESTGECKSQ